MELFITISILVLAGIVYLLVKYTFPAFATKIVDSHFNEKLESHKHELNKLTESAKFNYQRLLSDFNLYSVKKHEKCAKLYELLLVAVNKIKYVNSIGGMPTFEDFDIEDLSKYLIHIKLTSAKRQEILNFWVEKNLDAINIEVEKYLKIKSRNEAEHSFIEVKKEFNQSQLYLSDKLQELINELLEILGLLLECSNELYMQLKMVQVLIGQAKKPSDEKELKEMVDQKLKEIMMQMKRELSVGYYDN